MAPHNKQTSPKTSPHIPPEVLQTIFRKLGFYDRKYSPAQWLVLDVLGALPVIAKLHKIGKPHVRYSRIV